MKKIIALSLLSAFVFGCGSSLAEQPVYLHYGKGYKFNSFITKVPKATKTDNEKKDGDTINLHYYYVEKQVNLHY